MILVSITGDIVRRYDTLSTEGCTHVGRLMCGLDEDPRPTLQAFRDYPPAVLRVGERVEHPFLAQEHAV